MAVNDLSPAFIKLYYTVGLNTHVQVIPTKFSGTVTPGVLPALLQYDNGETSFEVGMTNLVNLYKVAFNTAASFIFAEAWSKPTPASDPIFIYQAQLGIAGTSATATSLYTQFTLTHRTNLGGIQRCVLLDTIFSPNVRDDVPFGNSGVTAISAFFRGNASFIYGRDGGKLIAAIRYVTKTNDVLRKRGILNIS